jgi:hypothetical protein
MLSVLRWSPIDFAQGEEMGMLEGRRELKVPHRGQMYSRQVEEFSFWQVVEDASTDTTHELLPILPLDKDHYG